MDGDKHGENGASEGESASRSGAAVFSPLRSGPAILIPAMAIVLLPLIVGTNTTTRASVSAPQDEAFAQDLDAMAANIVYEMTLSPDAPELR